MQPKCERYELHFGFHLDSRAIMAYPFGTIQPLQDMLVGFPDSGSGGIPVWHWDLCKTAARGEKTEFKFYMVDLNPESEVTAADLDFAIDFPSAEGSPASPEAPWPSETWPFGEPSALAPSQQTKWIFEDPPNSPPDAYHPAFEPDPSAPIFNHYPLVLKVGEAPKAIYHKRFHPEADAVSVELMAILGYRNFARSFVRDPKWTWNP